MAEKVICIEDHKVERVRHKILSGFMNKSTKMCVFLGTVHCILYPKLYI